MKEDILPSSDETTMQQLEYKVRFLTPAFLRGAESNGESNGQWRTPPIKALLRQWWRVAMVAGARDIELRELRKAEGMLFGHAWLGQDDTCHARASRVRLRLEPWATGGSAKKKWPRPGRDIHKVKTGSDGRPQEVRSDLYLGYGPIFSAKVGVTREIQVSGSVIDTDEEATLRMRCQAPSGQCDNLSKALQLMHWFGTLGARSRNGWGSLVLEGEGIETPEHIQGSDLFRSVIRPLDECLKTDWGNAIGSDDEGPLIWLTDPLSDWKQAVKVFAECLVSVRREAKRFTPQGAEGLKSLHLLGYPASSRDDQWTLRRNGKKDRDLRLASPLRFKLLQWKEGERRGMVFHMPCDLPEHFKKYDAVGWLKNNQVRVWEKIHKKLDEMQELNRMQQVR